MSYPPPIYSGDQGELSATYRPSGLRPGPALPPHDLGVVLHPLRHFEGLLRIGDMSAEEKAEFYAEHDNWWL